MSSTGRHHPGTARVDEPLVPRIYTCNRLCRQATPLSRAWALADWWRRAMRRRTNR